MRRALIIQDHDGVALALRIVLEDVGVVGAAVASGAEGLALAHTERFDLIFVDDFLPDAAGFDILRTLRAWDDATPAILMGTSMADPQMRACALARGADGTLCIPFTREMACEGTRRVFDATRGFGALRRGAA